MCIPAGGTVPPAGNPITEKESMMKHTPGTTTASFILQRYRLIIIIFLAIAALLCLSIAYTQPGLNSLGFSTAGLPLSGAVLIVPGLAILTAAFGGLRLACLSLIPGIGGSIAALAAALFAGYGHYDAVMLLLCILPGFEYGVQYMCCYSDYRRKGFSEDDSLRLATEKSGIPITGAAIALAGIYAAAFSGSPSMTGAAASGIITSLLCAVLFLPALLLRVDAQLFSGRVSRCRCWALASLGRNIASRKSTALALTLAVAGAAAAAAALQGWKLSRIVLSPENAVLLAGVAVIASGVVLRNMRYALTALAGTAAALMLSAGTASLILPAQGAAEPQYFPVVFGISLSFCIQMLHRYKNEGQMQQVYRSAGKAVCLAALVLAAVSGTAGAAPQLQWSAVYLVSGMVWSTAVALFFVPSLVALIQKSKQINH